MTSLNGYQVKDEKGRILATLFEIGGAVRVVRTAECSIGEFFYILTFLNDLGYNAK